MQFAPSNIPKFEYQHLHKDFKITVLNLYEAIDRIGYRNVSERCTKDDFIPVITEVINPNKQVTKKHVDERSLSFNTNFDACLSQAINSYKYRERKYGIDQAEQWKSAHTHIAEVPLTKGDGYMEKVPTGFHFNFAPFVTFTIKDFPRKPIDFTMEEVFYLQVQDNTPLTTLWIREDGECLLRMASENSRHLPISVKTSAKEVVKYLRKQTTLRAISKKSGRIIHSKLGMYDYYNRALVWNEDDIVERLYEIIKSSSHWQDQLFRVFCFRNPVL